MGVRPGNPGRSMHECACSCPARAGVRARARPRGPVRTVPGPRAGARVPGRTHPGPGIARPGLARLFCRASHVSQRSYLEARLGGRGGRGVRKEEAEARPRAHAVTAKEVLRPYTISRHFGRVV